MGIFGKKTENEVAQRIATVPDELVANVAVVADPVTATTATPAAEHAEAELEQPSGSLAVEKDQTPPPIVVGETINTAAPLIAQIESAPSNECQTNVESCREPDHRSVEIAGTSDTAVNGAATAKLTVSEPAGYAQLSDVEKCQIYALIFKYGCLGARQISKVLSKKSIRQWDELEAVVVQGEPVYFHTEASLRTYGELSGDAHQEMKKKAVFSHQVKIEMMPDILAENAILLAYEGAAKQVLPIYDWLSSKNPRRNRSIKIPRCDGKHESLAPDLAIIFEKQRRQYCLIIEMLPAYSAYIPGEKSKLYWDTIGVYHAFLAAPEEREKWAKKVKLEVEADDIAVVLIFATKSTALVLDLVHKLGRSEIQTPIYLGRMEDVLKKPFSCWYSCYEGDGPILKIQKYQRE